MKENIQKDTIERPSVICAEIDAIGFYRKMDTASVVEQMIGGRYVLVEEFYSNGLQILVELKRNLSLKYTNKTFQEQRDYRSAFREASHRLLLKVKENKLVVRKCPDIGWLKQLYPDISEFYICFPEVQGLNSSWQWYTKGLKIPLLNITLYPFFGTYFPTRFDHLMLFDQWLKKYPGDKISAIDIGVGSGILSFQMLQHGFQKIWASDTNKNAIVGVKRESVRLGFDEQLTLNCGDLFSGCDLNSELIVFNPPWLIAQHELEEGIDKAIYYSEDLFPRFFAEAKKHLAADGKIVLLFSNLAQVVGAGDTHPIIHELNTSDRFKQELRQQRTVKSSSKKTKRKSWRSNEKVELWVLTHNS